MNLRTPLVLIPVFLGALALSPLAVSALRPEPEIPNKGPEMLERAATHVAVVEVVRVYSVKEREGAFEFQRYVGELKVKAVEKGEGLDAPEPLYARWFTKEWKGRGMPPTGSSGHYGWTPEAGEEARVYLARNAHDGYTTDNRDGGYNVLVPNGFAKLEKNK